MRAGSGRIVFLAGEAETGRHWTAADERALRDRGGERPSDLAELAAAVRGALLFVGNDAGPTHLAAQLGVPTLALFGPSDPARWAPVGPRTAVVAPHRPEGMAWLAPEAALRAACALLDRYLCD
jgi:ADP-heptose:LPS heptosyltransferase